MEKSHPKGNFALIIVSYLTIYIVWGSTYFFIKLSVETIPPLYTVGLRFSIGGLLILSYCLLLGKIKPLPTLREIFSSMILGTFLLLFGNGFVTYAETKVDSYIAALFLASTPVAVAFFDWILVKKRISLSGIIGIFISIFGVGLLLYDGKSIKDGFTPEVIFVILGLLSWGFATSLGHRMKTYPDTVVNSGIQMLFVGIVSMIILSFRRPAIFEIAPSFSTVSTLSMLYLAVVGSIAFIAYNYLIKHEPAIRVVSYAFINPIIAVLLGLFVGNEKYVPYLIPGIFLILLGLFLMLYGKLFLKKVIGRFRFITIENSKNI